MHPTHNYQNPWIKASKQMPCHFLMPTSPDNIFLKFHLHFAEKEINVAGFPASDGSQQQVQIFVKFIGDLITEFIKTTFINGHDDTKKAVGRIFQETSLLARGSRQLSLMEKIRGIRNLSWYDEFSKNYISPIHCSDSLFNYYLFLRNIKRVHIPITLSEQTKKKIFDLKRIILEKFNEQNREIYSKLITLNPINEVALNANPVKGSFCIEEIPAGTFISREAPNIFLKIHHFFADTILNYNSIHPSNLNRINHFTALIHNLSKHVLSSDRAYTEKDINDNNLKLRRAVITSLSFGRELGIFLRDHRDYQEKKSTYETHVDEILKISSMATPINPQADHAKIGVLRNQFHDYYYFLKGDRIPCQFSTEKVKKITEIILSRLEQIPRSIRPTVS